MKIGIYVGAISSETTGGGATFQASLLQELMNLKSQHQFCFFYEAKHDLFKNSEQKFINIAVKKRQKIFGKRRSKRNYLLNFKKEVLKNKIDLMWFITPDYKEVDVPFVMTVWDVQHRLQTYFPEVSVTGWTFDQREDFYERSILKAAYIITGNKEGGKEVVQFYNYPPERIRSIPLPTPHFALEAKGEDEILRKNNLIKNSYLFYPAQFWPHKNHIRILKALKILQENNIDFDLVFSGSDKGNQTYIKQKVEEFGLEKKVKFLGFVNRPQLVSLYQNAFAMTFASMFGPDNIPPLEAMALKCPVICSNARGMKEQLGNAALFFDPLDEKDLAAKIIQLQNDENLKQNLVKEGHKLALSVTPDKYVAKMLALIDEFSVIKETWGHHYKHL